MREIAEQVRTWMAAGHDVVVARVAEMDGFGGRRAGEAWATAPASGAPPVGTLLSGSIEAELVEAATELLERPRVGRLITVPVGDGDAVSAGLACGGVAHVLLQRAAAIPPLLWTAIDRREPVVVASLVDADDVGASLVVHQHADELVTVGSLGEAGIDTAVVIAAGEMLAKGRAPALTGERPRRVLVEPVVPVSAMVVIGTGGLADALARQGGLLGWRVDAVDERTRAGAATAVERAGELGPVDALVVLSHDLPASCGALAAALHGRSGYVGALGSRHTQGARAQYLREHLGVDEAAIARVHGPVGLDLGSRTPEETALAIFAEVLAVRSGRDARSLRAGAGPING